MTVHWFCLSSSQMKSYLCFIMYTWAEELVLIDWLIDWFIHSLIHLFIIHISFIHTIHSFIHSSFIRIKHKNVTSYIWKYIVPFSEVQMWNKQLFTQLPCVCKGSAMHKPSTHDTHMSEAVEITRNNGLGSRATYIGILSLNVIISV